jgi:type II secretion system protein C
MKFLNKKFILLFNSLLIGFILAQLIVTISSHYLAKSGIEKYPQKDDGFFEIFNIAEAFNLKVYEAPKAMEPPKMITKTITSEELRQDTYKLNAVFLGAGGDFIIIEDGQQKVEFVNLGANYKIYKLTQIQIDKAVFEVYGSKYTLEVSKSGTLPRKEMVTKTVTELEGSSSTTTTQIVQPQQPQRFLKVEKNELKNYTGNVNKIWKEIKIKDIKENGKIVGFEIKQIMPDSVFSKLGLLQGDIIVSVNNKKLTKFSEAFYFYRNILKYKSLKITVLRNNQQKDIEYAIGN